MRRAPRAVSCSRSRSTPDPWASPRAWNPAPGFVMGLGLGGFIDGIVSTRCSSGTTCSPTRGTTWWIQSPDSRPTRSPTASFIWLPGCSWWWGWSWPSGRGSGESSRRRAAATSGCCSPAGAFSTWVEGPRGPSAARQPSRARRHEWRSFERPGQHDLAADELKGGGRAVQFEAIASGPRVELERRLGESDATRGSAGGRPSDAGSGGSPVAQPPLALGGD
jgi:hypothetical protein